MSQNTFSPLKSSLTIHIWSPLLKNAYLSFEFFTTDLHFKINRRKEPYTHSLVISNVFELHSGCKSFLIETRWIQRLQKRASQHYISKAQPSQYLCRSRTQAVQRAEWTWRTWRKRERGERDIGEKDINRKGCGWRVKTEGEEKENWEKVACGVWRGPSLLHTQLLNSLYLG